MIFSKKPTLNYGNIIFNGKIIKTVTSLTHLGLTLNNRLTWDSHIREKCTSAMKKVTILKLIPRAIPRTTKRIIYSSFIRPILEYANVIFDNCSNQLENEIENVQRQAVLAITGAYKHTKHKKITRICWFPNPQNSSTKL